MEVQSVTLKLYNLSVCYMMYLYYLLLNKNTEIIKIRSEYSVIMEELYKSYLSLDNLTEMYL